MNIKIPTWLQIIWPYLAHGLWAILVFALAWSYGKGARDSKNVDHNFYVEAKLNRVDSGLKANSIKLDLSSIKLDTFSRRQNWVIFRLRRQDIKDSFILATLQEERLERVKTKEEIIKTIKQFNPYYRTKYMISLDTQTFFVKK